jgi:phosphonate metabolism-associated iron-containing alcohol dehydrogenase
MLNYFKNYNPVNVIISSGNNTNLTPFINSNEKTLLIASESVLNNWPDLKKCLPRDSHMIPRVAVNPDINKIDQIELFPSVTQVIGIGGGSVLDTAKAMFAKILTKGQYTLKEIIDSPNILDETSGLIRNRCKLILVPTTFGTSSEITKWATLWDGLAKKKYSLSHHVLYADTAIIQPSLSLSLPKHITASTGLDVFSHALESIWNKDNNFITSLYSLEAISICLEVLPKLLKNTDSLEYRTEMSKASILAGMAFSQTKTAAAHSLSYPLTLFHNIPHGYACSITLGAMFEYNISIYQKELAEILTLFQTKYGDKTTPFLVCFNRFLDDCEIPKKLSDYQVNTSDISRLVKNAFHPERFKNMRYTLSEKEVRNIYEKIL